MTGLSPKGYAFLLLLKMAGREISNPEMFKQYGVRLVDPDYQPLNAAGWVESKTGKGVAYRHQLTPQGRKLLDGDLEISTTRNDPLAKVLPLLHRLHRDGVPGPVATDDRPLDERIRAAYDQLTTGPGAWVSLTRLRPLFADVPKADLDRALKSLLDAPDVNLEPEANQKTLTVEDRRAAVRIGGEDRHLLAIGLR